MQMERQPGIGFRQLASRLGVEVWQLRLALEHGLVPEPGSGRRWSAEQATEVQARVPQIVSVFGDGPPVGAGKAVARLALRLRLDVDKADIEVLVARGRLRVVGRYQQNPIYLLRDLDGLSPEEVAEVVAARKGPLLDRVDAKGAGLVLGWAVGSFTRIAAERGLPVDQLGRYDLADVRALVGEASLNARVEAEQREQALARAHRNEERYEEVLRNWIQRCTAYLDGAAEAPPDTSVASRALKGVTTARSTLYADTAQRHPISGDDEPF